MSLASSGRVSSSLSFVVALVATASVAHAQQPDPRQSETGAPVLVTALHGSDRPVAGTVSPDGTVSAPTPRPEFGVFLLGVVDRVDFSASDFTFDAPDGVAAGLRSSTIRGRRFGLGSTIVGGVSFGSLFRPVSWLELSPMAITLGGGSVEGPAQSPTNADAGYSVAISSVFLMRLHVQAMLRLPLGPVSLFAGGSAGLGVYVLGANTRHAQLGDLGAESVSAAAFELSWCAGATVEISDFFELTAGIRQTGIGADALGGFLGFGWAFGGEQQPTR